MAPSSSMQVLLLGPEDLEWPFEGGPAFRVGAGKYPRLEKVDPFPAYATDRALVEDLVAECCEAFPLRAGAERLFILSRELVSRVNGWASADCVWNRADGSEWEDEIPSPIDGKVRKLRGQALTICLSGKRIPIHPAMVRYTVAHEYGHCAFYAAARRLGYQDHETREAEVAYMLARGGTHEQPPFYGGGTWHLSASEIIANDFRVLIARREPEFWPHHGVAAPTPDSPIAAWWEKAREQLASPILPPANAEAA